MWIPQTWLLFKSDQHCPIFITVENFLWFKASDALKVHAQAVSSGAVSHILEQQLLWVGGSGFGRYIQLYFNFTACDLVLRLSHSCCHCTSSTSQQSVHENATISVYIRLVLSHKMNKQYLLPCMERHPVMCAQLVSTHTHFLYTLSSNNAPGYKV